MFRPVLFAALALATVSVAAKAQTPSSPFDNALAAQTVRFGDLDTSSSAGAKRLAFRIRGAARAVCGGNDLPVIVMSQGFDNCVHGAIERAATKVDNPMVDAALHLPNLRSAYAHR